MERTETKIDRGLLDAVRRRAAEEGRDESEIIEEALKRYLDDSTIREGGSARSLKVESFEQIFTRVREWQERQGVEPLSDEEAMKLVVEEQHAHRRGE